MFPESSWGGVVGAIAGTLPRLTSLAEVNSRTRITSFYSSKIENVKHKESFLGAYHGLRQE